MRLRSFASLVAGAALSGCLTVGSAQAVTTYSYVGNTFNFFSVDQDPPAGSYDATMKVTGSFTVANPLAPNLVNQSIDSDILSISFNDGRNTIGALSSLTGAFVTTNASGEISDWFIQLNFFPSGDFNAGDENWHITTQSIGDSVFISVCTASIEFVGCIGTNSESAGTDQNGGIWNRTLNTEAVPLPALPLFATGLGVMGLLGWRRKRTRAIAG